MIEFNLCWDSYRKNVCNGFSRLQQMEELVDMTLAADGCLVKVHKTLLAIASPYFKALIQSAPCPHPVLILQNVSYEILTFLLEFLYSGEVHVPKEKISKFIETAKALHITGLENFSPGMITDNPALKNPSHTTNLLGMTIEKQVNQRKAPKTISKTNKDNVPQNPETSSTPTFTMAPEIAPINNHIHNHHPRETGQSFHNEFIAHVNNRSDVDDDISEVMKNTSHISTKQVQSLNSVTEIDNLATPEHIIKDPNLCQEMDSSMNNVETLICNYTKDEDVNFSQKQAHNSEYPTINIETGASEAMETTNEDADDCGKKYFIDIQLDANKNSSKEPPMITIDQGSNRKTENPHIDVHKNPPLFFLNSKKGLQMIFNRFLYNAHHKGRLKRRWRCIDYRHKNCKAYIDTIGDKIIARSFCHQHGFHDDKILKRGGSKNVSTSLKNLISDADI